MNQSAYYYKVVEKFVSINGEGKHAGELAVFIRFFSCNLNCSYCDTQWIYREDATVFTLENLVKYIQSTGVNRVTLTGGEPLLREHIGELVKTLMILGHSVEIETNGSISIKKLAESQYRPEFTLDYKLPSSGMKRHMLTENYQYLKPALDVVKFVVGTQEDLECALKIIKTYDLTKHCQVYFSPVFGKMQPMEIVAFMKKNNLNQVRLQLQLHKLIWNPEERGV
ncbi:MAG: putative 7-carboxy-7-deazaguanine synthase QueE [Oscillospiraceae bacterium]|nr:putative 7-carboxy-7-deazaguanine synthase QueE [Oscillospiraceae bacterium]